MLGDGRLEPLPEGVALGPETLHERAAHYFGGYVAEARVRWAPRQPRRQLQGVIVSLTTYPARIKTTWLAVESLLRQPVTPERIMLVLSAAEFPERRLPFRLHEQQSRGLEVYWTGANPHSYKKLLPAARAFPDRTIVTADDDTLYPPWWLARLIEGHRTHPRSVIGLRGNEMLVDRCGKVLPYVQWPRATRSTPPERLFLKGNAGILYPPQTLPFQAFDYTLAQQLCPTGDDIWFKAMTLLSRTDVRQIVDDPLDPPTIRRTQRRSLSALNVWSGQNDTQLRHVFDYFALWDRVAV